FALQPAIPFTSARRYLPATNVLETTFTTDRGVVRLIDAMTLPDERLPPMRELVRSVEAVSGRVPLRWRCAPRFAYGRRPPCEEWRSGVPVATSGADAVAVASWNAGAPAWRDAAIEADFDLAAGDRALLAMTSAYAEPLILPTRTAAVSRLDATIAF